VLHESPSCHALPSSSSRSQRTLNPPLPLRISSHALASTSESRRRGDRSRRRFQISRRSSSVDAERRPTLQIPSRFCRVAVRANPSSDSNILIEVWLLPKIGTEDFRPAATRLRRRTRLPHLATSILSSYATSSTDTGHTGHRRRSLGPWPSRESYGFWLPRHPCHDRNRQTSHPRALGNAPHYSYFLGCSNGGRRP